MGKWQKGQRAVINRSMIVTIERVTPSGRAVANGRTFEQDGRERVKGGSPYMRPTLEILTQEIEAEIDLVIRGNKASRDAFNAVEAADMWLRQSFSGFGRCVPDASDVEKAELLTAAIRGFLP